VHSNQGKEYRGFKNTTKNGKTCQRWDSQSPHTHSAKGDKFLENYCRTPDGSPDPSPWCYTTDPDTRDEECGLPKCGK